MTPQDAGVLYSKLRANVFARHFAIGRYWRRNIFSEQSHLGNKLSMQCENKAGRPKKQDGSNLYSNAGELIDNSKRDENAPNRYGPLNPERWRVARREHANPLLQSGMHLTQLAVEAKLGNRESFKIIGLALKTIDSLYKFKDNPIFGGYILRYDPITCDEWFEYPKPNEPLVCCKFLPTLDPNSFNKSNENQYIYSTPDNDTVVESTKPTNVVPVIELPGQTNGNDHLTMSFKALDGDPGRFRLWEPSFDEITGLLGGYFMLWYCLKDDRSAEAINIVNEVKTQSDRLGLYLKETSYLLVRPNKGFTYYGCTGIGSMLEIICSRVFSRINDKPLTYYRTNHTFEDALKLAGVWTDFNEMISRLLPPGIEFPLGPNVNFPMLETLAAPFLGTLNALLTRYFGATMDTLGTVFGAISAEQLTNIKLNTFYVLVNYKVFNVGAFGGREEIQFPDDPRFEFAIGYFIKRMMLISEEAVFSAYFHLPFGFKPWVGLFTLGDPDPFYKDRYLNWFHTLPEVTGQNEVKKDVTNKAFFTAVALLLEGNSSNKAKLDSQLAAMYDTLVTEYNSDLFADDDDDNGSIEYQDNKSFYYGFTLPLSLKWLYDSNQSPGCLGSILPWWFRITGIPTVATMLTWPKAILPLEVIRSLSDFTPQDGNNYDPPLEYLPLEYTKTGISSDYFRPGGGSHPFVDIDLFEDPVRIPTVGEVSHMPPPVGYTQEITEYQFDPGGPPLQFASELIESIRNRGYREVSFSFGPPEDLPANLPRDMYRLDARLEILDEKGSSVVPKPIVCDANGTVTFKVRLKSYADWITNPVLGQVPDPAHLTNAYFKGVFYYAWIFHY
ncbi:MAG: hypothetical protein WCJ95_20280 [Mariniphaga sp.]